MAQQEFIEVNEERIGQLVNWLHEGMQRGSRYRGMSYEAGVMAAVDWLTGVVDEAPDEE